MEQAAGYQSWARVAVNLQVWVSKVKGRKDGYSRQFGLYFHNTSTIMDGKDLLVELQWSKKFSFLKTQVSDAHILPLTLHLWAEYCFVHNKTLVEEFALVK